jgi:hypothetical protein
MFCFYTWGCSYVEGLMREVPTADSGQEVGSRTCDCAKWLNANISKITDSRASTWQKVLDVYWDRPILVDQPHNLYPTCNFSIECPTINPNHGGVLNSRTLVSTIIAGFFCNTTMGCCIRVDLCMRDSPNLARRRATGWLVVGRRPHQHTMMM